MRRALSVLALGLAALVLGSAGKVLLTPPLGVLCFHGVGDGDDSPWTLTPEHYEALMAEVLETGRGFVGLSALGTPAAHPPGEGAVLLTFDDARPSHATTVPASTMGRGAPRLFFVQSAPDSRGLSDEVLRAMASEGSSIGSHTRTHAILLPLVGEAPAAYRERLTREIAGSRQELAAVLGAPPTAFAYTRGDWSPEAEAAVAAAGYQWAFTTDPSLHYPGDPPLRVPRLLVDRSTTPAQVRSFLDAPLEAARSQLLAGLVLGLLGVLGLRGTSRHHQ